MKKLMRWIAASGLLACSALAAVPAQAQNCSVWLVESSRFMGVPFGAFMPDRAFVPGSTDPNNNINPVDLPVNVGVIKCGKELILYDSGWKQQDYHKMTGTEHWAPLPDQLKVLGLQRQAGDQDRHRPRPLGSRRTADGFPERRAVHPARRVEGHRVGAELSRTRTSGPSTPIRVVACARPPAAIRPRRWTRSTARCCRGKAVIVDGEMEILPGVKIHPAFRAHTAGSQLLEVPTSIGKLVFGSDAYSSWEGIRDWMIANPQQTDTVQQFLAYEKCYKITGGYQNCVAGARAAVLHGQVSADEELLGRDQRRAHGRNRAGAGREVAQARSNDPCFASTRSSSGGGL